MGIIKILPKKKKKKKLLFKICILQSCFVLNLFQLFAVYDLNFFWINEA